MGLGDRRKCREIASQEEMQAKAFLGGRSPGVPEPYLSHHLREHHALPQTPFEERFGWEATTFITAGRRCHGERRPAEEQRRGHIRLSRVSVVEASLWRGDEEFPPRLTFTLPTHPDYF